ncbi:MAG: hypothetical protein JJ979_26645 [Roseibium sp.]|nr:hypothetical protein [Roseibium sp.]
MTHRIVRPDTAFQTGIGRRQKSPRRKDNGYLDWIRNLPCILTDKTGPGLQGVHAAHIRYGDRLYAKPAAGEREKPDDVWTLPLWWEKHSEQHDGSERLFWSSHGIPDPLAVCTRLYAVYPSEERAMIILQRARNGL